MAAYPVLLDELEGKQRYRLRAVEGKLSPDVVVPDGLVLYLPMLSGRGGTVLDHSGYDNHGTIYGAKWTKEDFGWALEFDGVDDYVDCGSASSLAFTGQITLAAWVRTTTTGYFQRVIGYDTPADPRYLLFIGDINTGGFYISDGVTFRALLGNTIITDGKWHHLCGVFDGTEATLFLNGRMDLLPTSATLNNFTASGCYIGAYSYGTPTDFYSGSISEVRIYNRGLSDAEIRLLYENTGPRRVFR